MPGYAAPEDTIDPATRVPIALLTVLVDSQAQGQASTSSGSAEVALRAALADLMTFTGDTVTPSALSSGVEAWAELVGLISLELFGHFKNSVTEPDVHFAHAVEMMAKRVLTAS